MIKEDEIIRNHGDTSRDINLFFLNIVSNLKIPEWIKCGHLVCFWQIYLRDDTHLTSMKIIQFSRPLTPIVRLRPKFFHALDLGRPVSNEPASPNDNQSIKRKPNPKMTIYVIKSFLKVNFRFQCQLINFVWLSFVFFSFSWSLTVSRSFILLRVQLSKIIYNYSYFWYSFSAQSNKPCNNNRTMHVNQQNQNKNKTKSRHI